MKLSYRNLQPTAVASCRI